MDVEEFSLTEVARSLNDAVPVLVERLGRGPETPGLYREALALLERPLLAHALALTGGNQPRAARLLGLNRNTVRKRCRELGLLDAPAGRAANGHHERRLLTVQSAAGSLPSK